jgi:glutaredoxin
MVDHYRDSHKRALLRTMQKKAKPVKTSPSLFLNAVDVALKRDPRGHSLAVIVTEMSVDLHG